VGTRCAKICPQARRPNLSRDAKGGAIWRLTRRHGRAVATGSASCCHVAVCPPGQTLPTVWNELAALPSGAALLGNMEMICPILATVGLITGLTAAWCWHSAIETAGGRAEKIAFVGMGQLYERATAWTATSVALSALCFIVSSS
jgi:hypothetical protein